MHGAVPPADCCPVLARKYTFSADLKPLHGLPALSITSSFVPFALLLWILRGPGASISVEVNLQA